MPTKNSLAQLIFLLPLALLWSCQHNVNLEREVRFYLPATPDAELAEAIMEAVRLYEMEPAGEDTTVSTLVTVVLMTTAGPKHVPLFEGVAAGITSDPNNVYVIKERLEEWRQSADLIDMIGQVSFFPAAAADSLLTAFSARLTNPLILPVNDSTDNLHLLEDELANRIWKRPLIGDPIDVICQNIPPPPPIVVLPVRKKASPYQNQSSLPYSLAGVNLLLESGQDDYPWRLYARRAEVYAARKENREAIEDYRTAVAYALACHEGKELVAELNRLTPSQHWIRDTMPRHFEALFYALEIKNPEVANAVPYLGRRSRLPGYRKVSIYTNHRDYWYTNAKVGLYATKNERGVVTLRLSFIENAFSPTEFLTVEPGATSIVNYTDGKKRKHLRIVNDSPLGPDIVTLHLRPRPGFSNYGISAR